MKKKNSAQERFWQTILQEYGYQVTDELDSLLSKTVKAGYFIEKEFKEKASNKNKSIIASKAEGSFSEAWRLYHDTFENNSDQVIDCLYASFKKNCKFISPSNLCGTVSLFRELGEMEKASEIIDIYIERRKDEIEIFNIKENNFFGNIKDEEIISKFNDIYNKSIIRSTAKEILKKISGKNGWNQNDEIVLANASVDDYYDIFKAESGIHLSSLVATCLKFGQFSNASDQQKEISTRATDALRKIASESNINKMRVRKFGINI